LYDAACYYLFEKGSVMKLRLSSQRKLKSGSLTAESLEPRRLLAGDVPTISEVCTASLLAGDDHRPAYVAGDANKDGTYDPKDVQTVVDAGKFGSGQPADWSEGDWNGDTAFDQQDVISAVQGWPNLIPIPVGFESEGIERGRGHEFFLGGTTWSGDLTNAGAVFKGNLCTGEGKMLVEATGKPLAGLSYDSRTNYIYAASGDPGVFAGSFTNHGIVAYDASSGQLVKEITIGNDVLINDILVTRNGLYGTDSINPALYKIPLGPDGQPEDSWEKIAMDGFVMDDAGLGFNANGLVGDFDGNDVVVINISTGVLYNVNAESGSAAPISIQGTETLFVDGDGMYMEGRMLYIMQNFAQKIAVVELSDDLTQGTFVKNLVSSSFAIPTTITGFGDSIYAINTRFCELTPVCGLDPEQIDPTKIQADVVRVDKRDAAFVLEGRVLGDANGNGEVDFDDFLALSANFGKVDAALADGDFNTDRNVDFADFLLLAMNFGKAKP
jgi:hypothetical protein